MGRSDEIMEWSLMEQVSADDFDDVLFEPNKNFVNLNEIADSIELTCGKNVAEDFKRFSLTDSVPQYKHQLIAFFTGRTDVFSEHILEDLNNV